MPKYKLLISYDGTPFGGWQVQPNAPSIQGHLQEALQTILRLTPCHVIGSGRTDAGVHAQGQVAHFSSPSLLDPHRTLLSLNALLPKEIRIQELSLVPDTFHARYSATGKIYHYRLHLDQTTDPFTHNVTTHYPYPLDLQSIQDALPHFIGTHDFTTFANEAHKGAAAKDPIRTLHRLDLIPEPRGILFAFEGDGFLYKMVRNITGTLLEIGRGRLTTQDIAPLFRARDRRLAPAAAPPQGLCLIRVLYPPSFEYTQTT